MLNIGMKQKMQKNIMNKSIESIKNLLKDWGELEKPIPGLSYSSDSIEARMMEYGGITSGTAVKMIPGHKANEHNNKVDQAIYCLEKPQIKIVMNKYIKIHLTDKERAVLAHMSSAAYYAELDSIYHYVAGSLGYSLR